MNNNQKKILLVLIISIISSLIYPPFQVSYQGSVFNMGYSWIFSPPKKVTVFANVNIPLLLMQWVGFLMVGGIAFFVAKKGIPEDENITQDLPTEKLKQDNTPVTVLEKNMGYGYVPVQEPTNINDNTFEKVGVGGWLGLLVFRFLVSPFLEIGRLHNEIVDAENYPILSSVGKWDNYISASWLVIAVYAVISIYAGIGLIKGKDWSVVTRAKIVLWITPTFPLIFNLLLPIIIFGKLFDIDAKFFGSFLASVVTSVIWIAYLSKSKRVRNTYSNQLEKSHEIKADSLNANNVIENNSMFKKIFSTTTNVLLILVILIAGTLGKEIGKDFAKTHIANNSKPDVAEAFKASALQLNKTAPVMIDEITRFDRAEAINNELRYFYTLPKYSSQEASEKSIQSNVKNTTCPNQSMKKIMENGGIFRYTYNGNDGIQITQFPIDKEICSNYSPSISQENKNNAVKKNWEEPITLTGIYSVKKFNDCCFEGNSKVREFYNLELNKPIDVVHFKYHNELDVHSIALGNALESGSDFDSGIGFYSELKNKSIKNGDMVTIKCEILEYGFTGHYPLPVNCFGPSLVVSDNVSSHTLTNQITSEVSKVNVKSKNINMETVDNTSDELKKLVQKWSNAHSIKDSNEFKNLFDESVLFYGQKKNIAYCIENKNELFQKYKNFSHEIVGDIQIEKKSANVFKSNFVKKVTVNEDVKDYPSYLVFRKNNEGWKIIEESDQITDKNLLKTSMQTSTLPLKNEIKLIRRNGVYEVPVSLNNVLKINIILDSGAADVSIAPDVALTLIRTGTIKDTDWLAGRTYRFADGSTAKSMRFKLESVDIGDKHLKNVDASIAKSLNSPMLLGQSALQNLGKYTIDYQKEVLQFE